LLRSLSNIYNVICHCFEIFFVQSMRRMNHKNCEDQISHKRMIFEYMLWTTHTSCSYRFYNVLCKVSKVHVIYCNFRNAVYQMMKSRRNPFSESEIQNWCFQIFQDLIYMHSHGYFQCDLNPDMWFCIFFTNNIAMVDL
jgi:serine/threonine protein kinase